MFADPLSTAAVCISRRLLLISVTAALTLVVFAAAIHVWGAEMFLDEELRRLTAKCDAFSELMKRVTNIEAGETTAFVTASGGLMTTTGPVNRLNRVQDAYRETVMDAEHFEVDYGESLGEHLVTEFGDNVAVAVFNQGQFIPQLKAARFYNRTARRVDSGRRSFRHSKLRRPRWRGGVGSGGDRFRA